MKVHLHQAVLAALAVVAVASGFGSVILDASKGSAASQEHVIEILHTGFNPENCWLDRQDFFTFVNKTDEPQRVLSNQNPHLDSGYIAPGEEAPKGFQFGFIGTLTFYLESNPDFIGKVTTDHGRRCEPLPPTPTPTPTPAPTPTPIPTPEGRKGLVPSVNRD